MAGNQMYTLDKFLGVNEAVDGQTEMKMGEAARIENYNITDGLNLETRPGAVRLTEGGREPAPVLATWSGYVGSEELLVVVDFHATLDRIFIYRTDDLGNVTIEQQDGALGLTAAEDSYVKIFSFAGKLFIMSAKNTVVYDGEKWIPASIYVPTIGISVAPSGGGGDAELINLLSPLRDVEFSADGESTVFQFLAEAVKLESLEIDNVPQDLNTMGTWDAEKHQYTFNQKPIKGVSNVIFRYSIDPGAAESLRMQIVRNTLTENYNGTTDSRIFMAGDGTSRCYYSGVPESGDLSQLYFPAGNEINLDDTASPITGLIRHYGKLLAYKRDGVWSITYQPLTLEGGAVIAAFMARAVSKGIGNDLMGQLQTVDNYPRSITHGGIYEWKLYSTGYSDERNYMLVSAAVQKSLKRADYDRIVTCDDTRGGSYYVFLNDNAGTVLVNRYLIGRKEGIWTIYKGELFKNVRFACMFNERPTFIREDGEIFHISPGASADANVIPGGESTAIKCIWESGFMGFGAPYLRKYSSLVYVSIQPESYCELGITAQTDRRSEYLTKFVTEDLFNFANINFGAFSFKSNSNPQIHRVRLKVKKFVYYKLVLKSEKKYSRMKVLGVDQQVRFSSLAK